MTMALILIAVLGVEPKTDIPRNDAPATCEARAVWNHSGTGAYPGDWDRSARLLAECGFNMVLPNMLWGGRKSVAQDWPEWVKAGLLDFICPMNYTENDQAFTKLVASQLELVDGRTYIYPGIGATASRSKLSADRVVDQIGITRKLGVDGFTIFNFHGTSAEPIIKAAGLGACRHRAVPPHSIKP